MPVQSIEYGVRVRCAEPGCDQRLENWSHTGTPGHPHLGVGSTGWFVYWRGRWDADMWAARFYDEHRARGFVCYCPRHSAPAVAWYAAFIEWRNRRWKVGSDKARELALSMGERWSGTVTVDRISELANQNKNDIGKAVSTWVTHNPAPRPPWLDTGA